MLVFYSYDSWVTIRDQRGDTHIVRHGHNALAIKHLTQHASQTKLLATDSDDSPVAVFESPISTRAFTPFGYTPSRTPVVAFKGEREDPYTRHYLLGNGYRGFNPILMRFNSPDSYSPFGRGGFNSYAFVRNDPINSSDPSGHFLQKALHGITQQMRHVWKGLGNALAGIDVHKPSKMFELQSVSNTADNIVRGKAYYNNELVDVIVSHGTPGRLHGINPNQDANYSVADVHKLLPAFEGNTIILASCYGAAVGDDGLSIAQKMADHYNARVLASTDQILFNEVPIDSPPGHFVIYRDFDSAPAHLQGIGTHFKEVQPAQKRIRKS